MPIAATDAIARIYFFTVTYLPQSGSAKARASRTIAVLPAIIPPMLLNNKPPFQWNHPRRIMRDEVEFGASTPRVFQPTATRLAGTDVIWGKLIFRAGL